MNFIIHVGPGWMDASYVPISLKFSEKQSVEYRTFRNQKKLSKEALTGARVATMNNMSPRGHAVLELTL